MGRWCMKPALRCEHYWLGGTPQGGQTVLVCQKCGAEKVVREEKARVVLPTERRINDPDYAPMRG